MPEAIEFIDSLDKKTRDKLIQIIDYAKQTKDPEVFKKLKGTNIWEFRVLFRRMKYRLVAFWDNRKGAYVICTHGIIKKTNKTPQKDIDKAERIRLNFLDGKS